MACTQMAWTKSTMAALLVALTGIGATAEDATAQRVPADPGVAVYNESMHQVRVYAYDDAEDDRVLLGWVGSGELEFYSVPAEARTRLGHYHLAVQQASPMPQIGVSVESHPVLGTPLMSSTFISRITRRLEDALSPTATIHGVLVDVLGVGLLLIGRSGVGKSEAALDLVLKGHRLVADDVVEVMVRPPDTVWGAATELHQHHMEIRGMGILNITHLFGVAAVRDNKKIEVVVELSEVESADFDRLGTESHVWPILSVDVPLVRIPLRPGRNIASLIEVVARNQLLKFRGHDSAREFQEKVNARIKAGIESAGVPEVVPMSSSQIVGVTEVE